MSHLEIFKKIIFEFYVESNFTNMVKVGPPWDKSAWTSKSHLFNLLDIYIQEASLT